MTAHERQWLIAHVRRTRSIKAPLQELHYRFYKRCQDWLWPLCRASRNVTRQVICPRVRVHAERPVALDSLDHLLPIGTELDNSTNKAFVRKMDDLIGGPVKYHLDLGCSGGQLVRDFLDLRGWVSVGIEGSDRSKNSGRACWPELAGKHLFTADITRPFSVHAQPVLPGEVDTVTPFGVVTAWEVLEHIETRDLYHVLQNVHRHLKVNGYFIASTSDTEGSHHRTRWPHDAWCGYIDRVTFGEWQRLTLEDIGLKPHQLVRYNFARPSILIYRRTN